jgi:putative ABC transport system substrate-binding protein
VLNNALKNEVQLKKVCWFSILVAAALLIFTVIADAQQTGKIFRIGFLDSSTPSGIAVLVEELRQELRKLGWIEGKTVTFEFRFAEQKPDRLPQLAAELVRLKVDLIVAPAGPSVLAAKEATKTFRS